MLLHPTGSMSALSSRPCPTNVIVLDAFNKNSLKVNDQNTKLHRNVWHLFPDTLTPSLYLINQRNCSLLWNCIATNVIYDWQTVKLRPRDKSARNVHLIYCVSVSQRCPTGQTIKIDSVFHRTSTVRMRCLQREVDFEVKLAAKSAWIFALQSSLLAIEVYSWSVRKSTATKPSTHWKTGTQTDGGIKSNEYKYFQWCLLLWTDTKQCVSH